MTAVAPGCKATCNCPQVAAEFGEKLDYAITLLECLVRYMGLDVMAITGMKPPSGPNHSMLNKNRTGSNFHHQNQTNQNHPPVSHQNSRGTSHSSEDSSEKDMFMIPPPNGTGAVDSSSMNSSMNFNFHRGSTIPDQSSHIVAPHLPSASNDNGGNIVERKSGITQLFDQLPVHLANPVTDMDLMLMQTDSLLSSSPPSVNITTNPPTIHGSTAAAKGSAKRKHSVPEKRPTNATTAVHPASPMLEMLCAQDFSLFDVEASTSALGGNFGAFSGGGGGAGSDPDSPSSVVMQQQRASASESPSMVSQQYSRMAKAMNGFRKQYTRHSPETQTPDEDVIRHVLLFPGRYVGVQQLLRYGRLQTLYKNHEVSSQQIQNVLSRLRDEGLMYEFQAGMLFGYTQSVKRSKSGASPRPMKHRLDAKRTPQEVTPEMLERYNLTWMEYKQAYDKPSCKEINEVLLVEQI